MDNKWHGGPPPSLGWWPASWGRTRDIYRWWDGAWSVAVLSNDDAEGAGFSAGVKAAEHEHRQARIEWKHRPADWPQRSRT